MAFNIDQFRSNISNNNEFALTDKFEVLIKPPSKLADYDMKPLRFQCEVSELPGKTINMVEFRHYGFIKRIPHHITYPEVTLTFLCNGKMSEKRLFDDWHNLMIPNESGLVEYFNSNDYAADITIIQYSHISNHDRNDELTENTVKPNQNVYDRMRSDRAAEAAMANYKPNKIYECTLIEALPVSMSSLPLNWADSSIHKLNVTFAYKKWIPGNAPELPMVTQSVGNYNKTLEAVSAADGRVKLPTQQQKIGTPARTDNFSGNGGGFGGGGATGKW